MDWLKCNICFNTYNESSLRPRSLSCGHTFCEKCLSNTIQNETLTCPQCRKIHEISSALDLPINFNLEGLLKSLNICANDVSEGAKGSPVEEDFDSDLKSESHGSLKSLLEQQEKSFSAQKELLKASAGLCNDHPSKECMFRCTLHMGWVCEQCIEDQGDHPKNKCKIISFKEEIEVRKKEHKRCLEEEGKSCDEASYVIENHISCLKFEKESHTGLLICLQNLIKLHKQEEENMQNEIATFQNIIEKGKIVKQELLNVESNIFNTATLDESNTTKDIIKNKKAEVRNWVNTSKKDVDDGELKIKESTSIIMETKSSLEYREKLHQEFESGGMEKLANKINSVKNKYARVVRDGIYRSSLSRSQTVTEERTFIPKLSQGLKIPSITTKFLEETDLGLTSDTATVWMDFSANELSLGRVCINVRGSTPHGEQFIKLALGTDGPTFKGTSISDRNNIGMAVRNYVTETGLRKSVPLLTTLKRNNFQNMIRGRVFVGYDVQSASFRIIRSDSDVSSQPGYFGNVITGMEVVDKVASSKYAITDITISDCGIVLSQAIT